MNGLRVNTTAWSLDSLHDLESRAKTLLHLHFSHFSQYYPSIVLPSFACILVATSMFIFSFSKLSTRPSKPSESLQALFTVIAPSSVAWPREYASLVKHLASSRARTVAISITSLIDNVCEGNVEVRDYADLPDLFSEKLVVYGWRLSLALDTAWNVEVLRWVIGNHFSWGQPAISAKQKNRPALKRAHGASRPKAPAPTACASFSITSNPHLELDSTPFSHLDASLLQLRTALAPGSVASLEFTTPASPLAFLSAPFSICAAPFLPRRYARTGVGRTATPLLASVHRILELLTAGPAALALESVSNVSRTYADGLNAAAEQLEEDRATRTAFIQRCGIAGWREQRLMMAWEAALFSAGYMTRWVVVVRKQAAC
ncbi:hypothetical protein B0H17DRAFT_1324416 [Mycena rosella]|uniref:Uncharacterized protein n=1 Tax=Mycena rosella TaxID=1033263 RepID=A0AAD7H0T0_MYCRO|nr:hypothetical protein B0H17DRAFT_1324416 [Mycena rosella]